MNHYGTDPLAVDTDGDGYADGEEVNIYHTDPLDASSSPARIPLLPPLAGVLLAVLVAGAVRRRVR